MMRKQNIGTCIAATAALIFLILDSKTVLIGATDGIEVVLHTVIPALFPFMLVTAMLNDQMIGRPISILKKLGQWCGMPSGAEYIMIVGMLGGYPIGAKTIHDACASGQLERRTAQRMLGFCNNAGPSFIFGILGPMFTRTYIPWIIWLIHILSALLVGPILPNKIQGACCQGARKIRKFSQIIEQSIKTMATICVWIIIWRIILAVCSQYFLCKFPLWLQVILTGMCELTNGCLALQSIENESLRFIIANLLLSAGGACIAMQTKSVIGGMKIGGYYLGKFLQILISTVLSILMSFVIYPVSCSTVYSVVVIGITVIIVCFICISKIRENNGSFSANYVI